MCSHNTHTHIHTHTHTHIFHLSCSSDVFYTHMHKHTHVHNLFDGSPVKTHQMFETHQFSETHMNSRKHTAAHTQSVCLFPPKFPLHTYSNTYSNSLPLPPPTHTCNAHDVAQTVAHQTCQIRDHKLIFASHLHLACRKHRCCLCSCICFIK